MDGKEVDLPDMKVEGSLAVAELTKVHADEFVPFVTTIQEEAILRSRVAELSRIILSKKDADDDTIAAVKIVLKFYNEEPADDIKTLIEQCNILFEKLSDKLNTFVAKTAKVSLMASPFFMQRSLLEAYYMMKAYIWSEARVNGKTPKMLFTLAELKTLIDDAELTLFTKYSMSKIRADVKKSDEPEQLDEPTLKKNWMSTPDTSEKQSTA